MTKEKVKEKKESKEDSGSKTLFPEIEVQGCTLRPWTLFKLEKLAPAFERIGLELAKRDIKISKINKNDIQDILPKIVVSVISDVALIISVSIDEEIENVRQFEMDKVIIFILAIVNQNIRYLKNLLGPMSELVHQMTNG